MRGFVTVLMTMAAATTGFAQLSIEGQYRARGEAREGFKKPILENQDPAAFIEHRARLKTAYKKDKLGFQLTVQDVRIWGETGQINKSDQLLSAHEAYADYYASASSTFRVGRQEMIYDDHRLFGNLDWAMQARSFDAVRYLYKDNKGNQLDLLASWNQEGYGDGLAEPQKLTGSNYTITTGGGTNTRIFNLAIPKSQLMGYYKKTFSSGDLGIMVLNDLYDANDSTTVSYSDHTLGITANKQLKKFKLGAQFYYTGGVAARPYNSTTKKYDETELSGYMASFTIQHSGIAGSPLIGVDYLSGDDESTIDKVEGWAPKYGTNHKFYGFMDYFYVGNGHGGVDARSAGLLDIYLKTDFKVGAKAKVSGHLHYFASTQKRTNAISGQAYDGTLGTELDLTASYALSPEISLQVGYSQMFGITETLKQLKFSNPGQEIASLQNWTWIMIAFSPKFM